MHFGAALQELKAGGRVSRAGWNGKGMFLFVVPPSGTMRAFIAMRTVQRTCVPWLASQTDMLAEDWAVVPEEGPDAADVRAMVRGHAPDLEPDGFAGRGS